MARPDPDRPDPDRLLADVDEGERIARRARLKVFIGAAPGVGKTYAMLQEAHELRRAGIDVVVGVVETHGRPETAALLEGLERIAPRAIEHRGVRLAEFDLDAALARRPGLLLLDELAHENAPGATHAKRWQDVRDLLAAGVAVATTLNVQHVESLNDVVARITGVRVRETVPDSILDRADEIEVVDLPADDLLQRLREGKVYVPEQARRALENFFKKGNLIALRELALRRAAERVGRQAESWRLVAGAPSAPLARERLLVLVDDPDTGPALVREGRRLADALHADWWVVHVQTPGALRHGDERRRAMVAVLGFAEDLGAESALLVGHEIAAEIAAFVRAQRIGRVLLGRGAGRGVARLWRRSLPEVLAPRAPGVQLIQSDVSLAGAPRAPRETEAAATPADRASTRAWLAALVVPAATTALGFAMRPVFELSNIIMIYLLGVVAVAVAGGRGPAMLATVVSVAAFDFCFVPPHLTFAVSDSQYLVTFGVMLLVAVVLSTMATRLQDQAVLSRQREERAAGLYRLSRELAASATPERVVAAGESAVAEIFGVPALVWTGEDEGGLDDHERGVARWVLDHGEPAGRGTGTLPAGRHSFVPLRTARGVLGVLGIEPDAGDRPAPDRLRLLRACADQVALALERARLAGEAETARLAAEAEAMRSTLLASVSHDLRTPLAVIQGAATTLRDRGAAGADRELLTTIVDEADRLNHLVGDLLDMTRLESGVELRRDWHPVEELVGSALARALPAGDPRPVEVGLPADLPLIEVDGVLVTQALIHLIENARGHTPPGTPIEIAAAVEGPMLTLEVADHGPGLAPGEEERVFEKFHRGASAGAIASTASPGPPGSGLGLAICRAIVEAHGGSIAAASRAGGGARFVLRLPIGAPPPPPPPGAGEDVA